jgi:hypothetical protein
MRSILALAAAAIALGACSTTFEKTGRDGRAIVVWEETGVGISSYAGKLMEYDQRNVQVEILGEVSRAGTVLLGAKKICLGESAKFGFHGPFPGAPEQIAEPFLRKAAAFYPPLLEKSIVIDRAHEQSKSRVLTGLQIHQIDPSIPICGPSVRTTTWSGTAPATSGDVAPIEPLSPITVTPLD